MKLKRLFDIVVAVVLLMLLAPLFAFLWFLVITLLGSPALFCQQRAGYRNRPFSLFKFRSMTNQTDNHGILLPDEKRLTRFGRWLRSSSLDELPEIWNILKGEMSFVGPRPLLMEYLERYSEQQRRRHDVKPGLTGWAQVNGRNSLSWQEKFDLDVWYVDHQSFFLDMKIILMTIRQVLSRKGISADDHATAPKFMGNGD